MLLAAFAGFLGYFAVFIFADVACSSRFCATKNLALVSS
jgi:hypothetical protein